jgi:hypothetical protein
VIPMAFSVWLGIVLVALLWANLNLWRARRSLRLRHSRQNTDRPRVRIAIMADRAFYAATGSDRSAKTS